MSLLLRRWKSSFGTHFENIDKTRGKLSLKPSLPSKKNIENINKIVLVASGKGGVGKSTTAVNLAIAAASNGLRAGILDTDIFGPSIPRMMNLVDCDPSVNSRSMLKPVSNYGIQCMSMGFLVKEDNPVVWRGLMLTKGLQQLLFQVEWDPLDILFVDLPPGTGDVPLTISQSLNVSGVVIVSTPQDIALVDVYKSYQMFNLVKTPVLGYVENMSYFTCPSCNTKTHIFKHGKLKSKISKELQLLAQLPLNEQVCQSMDTGKPIVISQPHGEHAQIYKKAADDIWKRLVQT